MGREAMLGKIMEKIFGLPLEVLKALYDLCEKLASANGKGAIWFAQLKRFLRKESCWVMYGPFLRLISGGPTLFVDECDGLEGLADPADEYRLMADIENIGADERGQVTGKTGREVYELVISGRMAEILAGVPLGDREISCFMGEHRSRLEKLCWTPGQVRKFIIGNRFWIRAERSPVLLPYKSGEKFFVAYVYFYSDGKLKVNVYRLTIDYVWDADYRPRVVVPQQETL